VKERKVKEIQVKVLRTFFLKFGASPCLKIKIGLQTPTTNLSLYDVIRHNQVEKFVFLLQKKTHLIIPIPISLGQIFLPIPRRHKKRQTTIPIALRQIYLPIPRRHEKLQTKVPIALGQICLPIPSRHKKIQTTIPISLGQICLPIPRRYKQQFQLHLDKFIFQFQEETRIYKKQFQLHLDKFVFQLQEYTSRYKQQFQLHLTKLSSKFSYKDLAIAQKSL
jgi:hypothetical protein